MKHLAPLALTVSMFVAACGPLPPEQPDAGRSPSSNSSTASLEVVNNSSESIYYLRVSPSTTSDWGPDQLGANIIGSGQSYRVVNIPCGQSYDLRAEASGGAVLATRFGVYFACGDTMVWTLR